MFQLVAGTGCSRVVTDGQTVIKVSSRSRRVTVTIWNDKTGERGTRKHDYASDTEAFKAMRRIAQDFTSK